MRTRLMAAGLAALIVAVMGLPAPASASPWPSRLARLAAAQTQQLFRYYEGQPQVASPSTCAQATHRHVDSKVLLLPTLSFGSGDAAFDCTTRARRIFVDLGGAIATEDARGDTYTLAGGEVLTFTRANLERICTDVVRFLPGPAPATLDGSLVDAVQVTTKVFRVHVRPGADNTPGSPYYQDSIDLGHPGVLASCYAGFKALLDPAPGVHTLRVDLSTWTGSSTIFTYTLHVLHGHDR